MRMIRRAYSYTRFSSLRQEGNDSVRRQTAATREWCKANKVELVEDFADLGVSAFRGKNADAGALSAFMRLAEGGRIPKGSLLIVESLDRITRSEITKAVTLFLRIIGAGVEIVTLADNQRYNEAGVDADPTRLIISVTILMRAHEESAMKSKRVLASWEQKRKRAKAGEIISANGPRWLKLSGGEWKVDERRAAVVRRIFALAVAGSGLNLIARALNDDKTPTFKGGKQWISATIAGIIDGRAVLGELVFDHRGGGRKAAPVEGYYPAIISPAQWAAAQRVRASHRGNRGGVRPDAMLNVFRGVVFTPDGAPLHVKSCLSHGKRYAYLRNHRHYSTGEPSVSWNYDDFKALFLALASRVTRRERPAGVESAAERLKLEIEAVRAKESNLAQVLANGYLEPVERELRKLGGARAELEERLLGAQAMTSAESPHASSIDWNDDEALADNVRATVRRIVVDCIGRRFEVEMLTGEVCSLEETPSGSLFCLNEPRVVMFPRSA